MVIVLSVTGVSASYPPPPGQHDGAFGDDCSIRRRILVFATIHSSFNSCLHACVVLRVLCTVMVSCFCPKPVLCVHVSSYDVMLLSSSVCACVPCVPPARGSRGVYRRDSGTPDACGYMCACVHVYRCTRVCMCVCVCVRARACGAVT
jgi:hypothetical protein